MNLKQLRIQQGIGQAVVAERMGVSQPYISQLEAKPVDRLRVCVVQRYLAAIGLELVLGVSQANGGLNFRPRRTA